MSNKDSLLSVKINYPFKSKNKMFLLFFSINKLLSYMVVIEHFFLL